MKKPLWAATALFVCAFVAGGVVTLHNEGSAGGDETMTISPYRPTLAVRPSPEEAMASVVYVNALKAAEVEAYFSAVVAAEKEAAAQKAAAKAAADAKAKAASRATAVASSSSPSYSSGGYGKWDPILQCESSGNWSMNSGNGFTGGLQFMTSTWLAQGGGKYAPAAYLATPAQQIEIAERTLASGGWSQWPACSRKAGYR
jgi:hypothetical protein